VSSDLRRVLGRMLGRSIEAGEEVEATVRDLHAVADELEVHRRLAMTGINDWRFSDVPELVVQTVSESGVRSLHRLAGGPARADDLDPTQRAYARLLLGLARDQLDATEPSRTEGRSA